MHHGISAPNAASPAQLVTLAVDAERLGWDGFFLWDHLQWIKAAGVALADPIVTLGAIAQATSKIRIGALVTPVPRRRPWKLAKEIATLDHLSQGRVIFEYDEHREVAATFGNITATTVGARQIQLGGKISF